MALIRRPAVTAMPRPLVKQTPVPKPGPEDPTRLQTRIDYLTKRRPNDPEIAKLRGRLAATNPTQSVPTGETPQVINSNNYNNIAGGPNQQQPNSQDMANTLFPGSRMFEPQNYAGSPLYQFQVKEGLNQVDKSLAARGLSNSGYGIRQELNVPMMAAAQDTNRMQSVAENNANRLWDMQQQEAGRLERGQNNQWDRLFSLAQLQAQQSPWAASIAGLNNTSNITGQAGKENANMLRDLYQRVIASGGGGGARAPYTPIPMPSGPNYSGVDYIGQGVKGIQNNNTLGAILGGFSGLFK